MKLYFEVVGKLMNLIFKKRKKGNDEDEKEKEKKGKGRVSGSRIIVKKMYYLTKYPYSCITFLPTKVKEFQG